MSSYVRCSRRRDKGERKINEAEKKEKDLLRQTTAFSPSYALLFSRFRAKFAGVLHTPSPLLCLIIYSSIAQFCVYTPPVHTRDHVYSFTRTRNVERVSDIRVNKSGKCKGKPLSDISSCVVMVLNS